MVTLSATGVNDRDGTVSLVDFYRDANANYTLDAADTYLGTDSSGADGWSTLTWTYWFPIGMNLYFAQATDNEGLKSNVAMAANNVLPATRILDNTGGGSDAIYAETGVGWQIQNELTAYNASHRQNKFTGAPATAA